MNGPLLRSLSVIIITFLAASNLLAHPTGNLIVVGEYVLWSYINPIDDDQHHACIMIWHPKTGVDVFLQSEYPASDYMLFNEQRQLFIIERKYREEDQGFESRILTGKIGEKPVEIWPWFVDKWRIGEGGFLMNTESQIVFGKYPHVYCMDKGEEPVTHFDSPGEVNKIRAVEGNQIMLIGTASCWLTDVRGNLKREWNNLIDGAIQDPPLNRNQLFDADFHNDQLLVAYWGNRSFNLVDDLGNYTAILQQREPIVPHWVGFYGEHFLLFSSRLVFTGQTPRPQFLLFKSEYDVTVLWEVE